MKKCGTLYGIGVGPGDPDLITLAAIKRLAEVDAIFAASAVSRGHSLALNVALRHIPRDKVIIELPFTMARDRPDRINIWAEHSQAILEVLEEGNDAAFLTLGDPMTFSTFGAMIRLLTPVIGMERIKTIPGITCYQAAAARMNRPLVEEDESLLICSGGGISEELTIDKIDNFVILKPFTALDRTLDFLGVRTRASYAIKHCTRENEKLLSSAEALRGEPRDYWTILVAQKRQPES